MGARGPECVLTIGVYGFDEDSFFDAVRASGCDLFCDIRARRGVRGARYAFANSRRLQDRLRECGIAYAHVKELAPSREVRLAQHEEDRRLGVRKRTRDELGAAFIDAYRATCLDHLDIDRLWTESMHRAERPLLFCVERAPRACHRSLVADWFVRRWGIDVRDLEPCGSSSSPGP